MDTSEDLQKIVGHIRQLPTLPANIDRLNQMMDQRHATMEAIGKEIAKDQSLSAQVLKLINSSFYGFTGRISSISHATVLLGLNTIRNLLSTAWASNLIESSFPGLYEHSLACSRTCYLLSRNLSVGDPNIMSSIGLLHDIGKMILAEHLHEQFELVITATEEKQQLFCNAEKQVMCVTHADIGPWLLKKWNLPESSIEPIKMHHNFNKNLEFASETAVLILADAIVRAEGFGWPGDNQMPFLPQETVNMLGLIPQDLERLMDETADQMYDIPRYESDSIK